MATMLIRNIRQLYGIHNPSLPLRGEALAQIPVLENAYVIIEDDQIAQFGRMEELDAAISCSSSIDAKSRIVFPAWCDSHTHLVFPSWREEEFLLKLKGLTYAEIASAGGGILNSALRTETMSEDELFIKSWKQLEEIRRMGTGDIEIKSGYGLTVEGELKILRVIRRLREKSTMLIKSTFLGAHAYPPAYREDHQGYIDQIITEMLPQIAAENLADFIDVFCEQGFFSNEETERICNAGKEYGLRPKIHANQLSSTGAVETGIALNALSVDHLETMDDAAIKELSGSDTIGTLLPTAAYFLRMPYPPARQLIKSGAAIALATDFNPGSSPSANMNLVVSMSCIQMKMLPEEAINAATINGAFAMEVAENTGTITVGKQANLIITKAIPSLSYLPYAFGADHIEEVIIAGEKVRGQ